MVQRYGSEARDERCRKRKNRNITPLLNLKLWRRITNKRGKSEVCIGSCHHSQSLRWRKETSEEKGDGYGEVGESFLDACDENEEEE